MYYLFHTLTNAFQTSIPKPRTCNMAELWTIISHFSKILDPGWVGDAGTFKVYPQCSRLWPIVQQLPVNLCWKCQLLSRLKSVFHRHKPQHEV